MAYKLVDPNKEAKKVERLDTDTSTNHAPHSASTVSSSGKFKANKVDSLPSTSAVMHDLEENCLEITFSASKQNSHLAVFNFNITTENMSRQLSLVKCDLCSHLSVEDAEEVVNNLRNTKAHILSAHIAPKVQPDEDSAVILAIVESLIRHIESDDTSCPRTESTLEYKCSYCVNSNECLKNKPQLVKHISDCHPNQLNSFNCLYCSRQFSLRTTSDFFAHLKMDHKDACMSLLEESHEFKVNVLPGDSIDWNEYFTGDEVDDVTNEVSFMNNDEVNFLEPVKSVSSSEEVSNDSDSAENGAQTKEARSQEDNGGIASNENDNSEEDSNSKSGNNNEETNSNEPESALDELVDSSEKLVEENSKSDSSEKGNDASNFNNKSKTKGKKAGKVDNIDEK